MIIIYVDESGDLGFNFDKGSSKWFVFSFIFCEESNSERPRKELSKLRGDLVRQGIWPTSIDELKFNLNFGRLTKRHMNQKVLQETRLNLNKTREIVLRLFSGFSKEIKIYLSIVDKSQIKSSFRNNKPALYNDILTQHLINDFIKSYDVYDNKIRLHPHFKIILDKNLTPLSEKALSKYIRDASISSEYAGIRPDFKIEVEQKRSQDDPLIWIADYVASAIHYKYEHNDNTFADIINHLIEKDSLRHYRKV